MSTDESPQLRLGAEPPVTMAFAKRILHKQDIAVLNDPLFAVADFDFRFASEKQHVLTLRGRVPVA